MRNIIDFFKATTGLDPNEGEKTFLLAGASLAPEDRKILVSSGRQCGKSLCAAVITLWWVFEYEKPVKILLMSAKDSLVYSHIQDILDRNQDLWDQVLDKGKVKPAPIRGLTTVKSEIFVRGSTNKQVRGLGVDVLVADECAEIDDELIETALLNFRSDAVHKVMLLSTPHKSGFFVNLVQDPQDWKLLTWSRRLCDWHRGEEKEMDALKSRNPQKYKQEIEGIALTAAEHSFFMPKWLDKMFVESLSSNAENKFENKILFGLDTSYGSGPCKNCLTVVEKAKTKIKLIKQFPFKEFDLDAIQDLINQYHPKELRVDSRPTDLYNLIKSNLKSVRIIKVDKAIHKSSILTQLQTLVRTSLLKANKEECKALYFQMLKFHPDMRTGDLVDSLALACFDSTGLWKETPGRYSISKVSTDSHQYDPSNVFRPRKYGETRGFGVRATKKKDWDQ